MERLAEKGPLKRLGHGAIEVGDELQHLPTEVVDGGKVAPSEQLADQDVQPKLDLVQPGRVFGRVVEDDLMRWIGQEGDSRRHSFKMPHLSLMPRSSVIPDTPAT